MALENNEGKIIDFTDSIIESWSENWVRTNDDFKKILQADEDLKVFHGKMFVLSDGNHYLQAWLPIINRDHTHHPVWHYAVESIILDVKEDIEIMLKSIGNYFILLFLFVRFIWFSF